MERAIIFGMGKYFESKMKSIEKEYNIVQFLDNRIPEGSFEMYKNIRINNPRDIKPDEECSILLMSVRFIGMWKQLCGLGVRTERIILPFALEPYFENDNALAHCLEKIVFQNDHFMCIQKDGQAVKITDEVQWAAFLRDAYKSRYPVINSIAGMSTEPVSRQFATERGTPVDRFYIEDFLRKHQEFIFGDVLEIEDSTYTKQFGGGRLRKAMVMGVGCQESSTSFNCNLETGEGLRYGIADCFICTQTLMYLFDLKHAAHNIECLLKDGGAALITCSGISQNSIRCMDNYGCYFNFNKDALVRMFEEQKSLQVLEAGSLGNVKTVSAHLNGLCCEDLQKKDFVFNDPYYPLIVYTVVKKHG